VLDGLFNVNVETFVLIAIFLGIGFPVHEAAHAFAADRLGDSTARLIGRLTLNPVKHFDPLGGTLFVLSALVGGFIIGWAKPTPVNVSNLRDRRNSEVVVALAGPGVNVIMACVAALVFRGLVATEATGVPVELVDLLILFVFYNVALTVFNLIPIPPLDGSTLLFRFIDPVQAWRLRPMLAQYGFVVILVGVLVFGREIGQLMFRVTLFLVGG
jgi:Zn-dependent protease